MQYLKERKAELLSTNGACFFCWRIPSETTCHSILALQHLLKVDVEKIAGDYFPQIMKKDGSQFIENLSQVVELCPNCSEGFEKFSLDLLRLEAAKMSVDANLQKFHWLISEGKDNRELVTGFEKKVTGDYCHSIARHFVSDLRKEIETKCAITRLSKVGIAELELEKCKAELIAFQLQAPNNAHNLVNIAGSEQVQAREAIDSVSLDILEESVTALVPVAIAEPVEVGNQLEVMEEKEQPHLRVKSPASYAESDESSGTDQPFFNENRKRRAIRPRRRLAVKPSAERNKVLLNSIPRKRRISGSIKEWPENQEKGNLTTLVNGEFVAKKVKIDKERSQQANEQFNRNIQQDSR